MISAPPRNLSHTHTYTHSASSDKLESENTLVWECLHPEAAAEVFLPPC